MDWRELAEMQLQVAKARNLEAYRVYATGLMKKEVAEKFGVSSTRSCEMIRRGFVVEKEAGLATREP